MTIKEVKIGEIIESEYNPRKISSAELKEIKDSLEEFGMVKPLIVNKNKHRKNILIGGHQRLKIWKSLKYKTVPVVFVDLDLKKEQKLNIKLNKTGGDWDFDLLKKYFDKERLIQWGFHPYQFEDVTFIQTDENTINVDHNHSSPKESSEAVMLEIPMSPSQKKEIMLTINQYKENMSISNGQALYEIVSKNFT